MAPAINRPSKCDHRWMMPWLCANRSGFDRQPAEQVRSLQIQGEFDVSISTVNQSSKYDHNGTTGQQDGHALCERAAVPVVNRPSKYDHQTIVLQSLVPGVNRPSKYDHRRIRCMIRRRASSRLSTDRASAITGRLAGRVDGRYSPGHQPTEQVRSRGRRDP